MKNCVSIGNSDNSKKQQQYKMKAKETINENIYIHMYNVHMYLIVHILIIHSKIVKRTRD